jgi:RecB family exonuclease
MTADSLSEDEKRLFHVATTRATQELHLSAISREEDSPSQYFLDATDDPNYTHRTFDDVRPLTASALVASLRRSLSTSQADQAAALLSTLAQADIAIADPHQWLGSQTSTTDSLLFHEDELVPISPSAAESFEQCGLKWLLERNGGSNGDSVAQLLGSVIHEYARLKVEGADMSDEALQQSLNDAWPLISESSGWISKTQLARASKMLERFAQYHRENPNVVEGVELEFNFTVGRAKVRGSVDRLEVDSDGKYFVVDFKTGEATGYKEARENIQLACYQMAVILNAFDKKFDNPEVSGSHLVFLGHGTKEIATRERAPIVIEDISEHLESVAEKMSSTTFIARKNEYCGSCPVRPSCPLHLEGRTVIG